MKNVVLIKKKSVSEARYSLEIVGLISPVATHWGLNQGPRYCYFHCREKRERRQLIKQDRGVNDASSSHNFIINFFYNFFIFPLSSCPSFLVYTSSSSLCKNPFFTEFEQSVTQTIQRTNQRIDQRTNKASYRDVWTHLKI